MIKIPYYENSYFALHNFSAHVVKYKGVEYPTAEHAYNASKFGDLNIREEIRNARSPLEAFNLAKKHKPQLVVNWHEIKVNILYEIVKEKVAQHEEVKNVLLATDDEEIMEENPNDDFWGSGEDGKGENHTGKILMKIRKELKN